MSCLCTDNVCQIFFFQAEDGIRDLVRSRGLGDVYKRQLPAPGSLLPLAGLSPTETLRVHCPCRTDDQPGSHRRRAGPCLLYTSDAADERSSVDLGGRRIIKKKKHIRMGGDAGRRMNQYLYDIER